MVLRSAAVARRAVEGYSFRAKFALRLSCSGATVFWRVRVVRLSRLIATRIYLARRDNVDSPLRSE